MDRFCAFIEIKFHVIDKPHQRTGEFRVEVILRFSDNFGFREGVDNCFEISDRLRWGRVVGQRLNFILGILALTADTVGRTRARR